MSAPSLARIRATSSRVLQWRGTLGHIGPVLVLQRQGASWVRQVKTHGHMVTGRRSLPAEPGSTYRERRSDTWGNGYHGNCIMVVRLATARALSHEPSRVPPCGSRAIARSTFREAQWITKFVLKL